eukprot:4961187-Amphidinium_carterae.1
MPMQAPMTTAMPMQAPMMTAMPMQAPMTTAMPMQAPMTTAMPMQAPMTTAMPMPTGVPCDSTLGSSLVVVSLFCTDIASCLVSGSSVSNDITIGGGV